MKRRGMIFAALGAALVAALVADIMTGPVSIAAADVVGALTGRGDVDAVTARIVVDIRLVKALTALLAGAALSVSGLLMQTLFRNPLAGPYVLGLSSGASLGVALFILGAPLLGVAGGMVQSMGVAGAAWIGAACVLAIVAAVGRKVKDIMVVLILGIMFSSGVGAVVQILQYLSDEASLKSFVVWTMGSLGDVTPAGLGVMVPSVAAGLVTAYAAVKPLNLLLLGEDYAVTTGVDIRRSRIMILGATTLLAGTVTAFCGPIAFIGLAMPHVTRVAVSTADHRTLLPATAMAGGTVLILCDIVSKCLTLPINSITSLLGVPAVVWIVWTNRSMTR